MARRFFARARLAVRLSVSVFLSAVAETAFGATPVPVLHAVDALGRETPLCGRGAPALSTDKERLVGLFYFLWCGENGRNPPRDISKILAENPKAGCVPEDPVWGGVGFYHHWGEPYYGYYYSDDEWVVRHHMKLLLQAGVDFLFFDVTNGPVYERNAKLVMRVLQEYHDQGWTIPRVMFYTHSRSGKTVQAVYDSFYRPRFAPDTWFRLDGKPVIVYCTAGNLERDFMAEARARGEKPKSGEGMRRALEITETMAKEAGLPGIYWVNMSWLRSKEEIAFAPKNLGWLKRGGFVARMTYNLGGNTPFDMSPELRTSTDTLRRCDYGLMVAAAEKVAAHADDALDMPLWPAIPTGYNDTSRAFQGAYLTTDITREKFARACRSVRRACDEKGLRRVVVSPVNEWQEGSMAEPNHDYGFERYDAIREAFCEKPAEGWPRNETPESVGLSLHEYPPLYRHPDQKWDFTTWQEGWYRNPFGAYTVVWQDGVITFRTVRHRYNIRTRVVPFDASRYTRFGLRMRITPNPGNGPVGSPTRLMQLKWGTEKEPIIRADHTVDFTGSNVARTDCIPDGQWHEYTFDLTRADRWQGAVNELWFGLTDLPQAVVDIDWMRFE